MKKESAGYGRRPLLKPALRGDARLLDRFSSLRHIFADGGYRGDELSLRMARTMPTPRQGLGNLHRLIRRMDLCRLNPHDLKTFGQTVTR